MIVAIVSFAVIRAGMLIVYRATGILNILNVAAIYPITWALAAVLYFIIWKKASKKLEENTE